jgi:putative lipoic acid-binding regulatory protein
MSNNEKIDDGFDLLDYPCVYTFKAMCRNQSSAISAVKTLFSENNIGTDSVEIKFSIKPSGKGTYVSVSAVLSLQNREALEDIYQKLHQHDQVLMTL